VPAEWSGIVDLSNCMSAQLASAIGEGRRDRSILCNDGATNPVTRMMVLAKVYELLADTPHNYVEVRFGIATRLREAIA
jgi:hypothetical protein